VSFPAHLAAVDAVAFAGLLEQRDDVLVEPAPLSIVELASRLDGVAWRALTGDCCYAAGAVCVGRLLIRAHLRTWFT
jgi:hypothetical protein